MPWRLDPDIPSDIIDRDLDAQVERCRTRPLPSGMITVPEASVAFVIELAITCICTYLSMGTTGVITFAPIWILFFIYPFMKRVVQFPQVILGATVAWEVFPGWVAVTGDFSNLTAVIPLFFATTAWVIYFDTIYATQDTADDKKVGVKSLAVLLEGKLPGFLAFLGGIQVAFFVVVALKGNMSLIFWLCGIAVWAANIPWHIMSLDTSDRQCGGRLFRANIMLGLYFSVVAILDLAITRVDWANENVLEDLRLLVGSRTGGWW